MRTAHAAQRAACNRRLLLLHEGDPLNLHPVREEVRLLVSQREPATAAAAAAAPAAAAAAPAAAPAPAAAVAAAVAAAAAPAAAAGLLELVQLKVLVEG